MAGQREDQFLAGFLSGMLNQLNKRQAQNFQQKQYDVQNQQRQQGLDMQQERLGFERENQQRQTNQLEQGMIDQERAQMAEGIAADVAQDIPLAVPGKPEMGLRNMPRIPEPTPQGVLSAQESGRQKRKTGEAFAKLGFDATGKPIKEPGTSTKTPMTPEDITLKTVRRWRSLRAVGPHSTKALDEMDDTFLSRAASYQTESAQFGVSIPDEVAINRIAAGDQIGAFWARVQKPEGDPLGALLQAIGKRVEAPDQPLWKGRTVMRLFPQFDGIFDPDEDVDMEDVAEQAVILRLSLDEVFSALFANLVELDQQNQQARTFQPPAPDAVGPTFQQAAIQGQPTRAMGPPIAGR